MLPAAERTSSQRREGRSFSGKRSAQQSARKKKARLWDRGKKRPPSFFFLSSLTLAFDKSSFFFQDSTFFALHFTPFSLFLSLSPSEIAEKATL